MKFLAFSQTKILGSSFDITRARVGGASVIPLLSSLLFFVPPSRRKVLGAKPKQAGKGGWGEGIFARPRFPIPIFFRRRRISYLKKNQPLELRISSYIASISGNFKQKGSRLFTLPEFTKLITQQPPQQPLP